MHQFIGALWRALTPLRRKQEVQTTQKQRPNRFLSEVFCGAQPVRKQQCCWSDSEIRKAISFIISHLITSKHKASQTCLWLDIYLTDTYLQAPTHYTYGHWPTHTNTHNNYTPCAHAHTQWHCSDLKGEPHIITLPGQIYSEHRSNKTMIIRWACALVWIYVYVCGRHLCLGMWMCWEICVPVHKPYSMCFCCIYA